MKKYKVKFMGEVTPDGRLRLANPKAFNSRLNDHRGKKVILTLEELTRQRTADQNALYWMYLHTIADSTGDDVNYLHEVFKKKFLSPVFIEGTYGVVEGERSTVLTNTKEFSEYMEKIQQLTNIPIPDTEAYRLGYSIGL